MTLDLEVFRAETRTLNFTVQEDGSNVDISNATIYFRVKNNLSDPDETPVIEKSTTSGLEDGSVSFTLTDTDTDVRPRVYKYEVEVEFDDGTNYRAEVGDFNVRKIAEK